MQVQVLELFPFSLYMNKLTKQKKTLQVGIKWTLNKKVYALCKIHILPSATSFLQPYRIISNSMAAYNTIVLKCIKCKKWAGHRNVTRTGRFPFYALCIWLNSGLFKWTENLVARNANPKQQKVHPRTFPRFHYSSAIILNISTGGLYAAADPKEK